MEEMGSPSRDQAEISKVNGQRVSKRDYPRAGDETLKAVACSITGELVEERKTHGVTIRSRGEDEVNIERYTWVLDDFQRLNDGVMSSNTIDIGGYKWRIILGSSHDEKLEVLLSIIGSQSIPCGCSVLAHFFVTVVNQVHPVVRAVVSPEAGSNFDAKKDTWGIALLSWEELFDPSGGFLENASLMIEMEMRVEGLVCHNLSSYLRKEGFVGLKNQGGTSYLNSCLQILYHLPSFRKAVYQMHTTVDELPEHSIPLALQKLFYKMQCSETSVGTEDLTRIASDEQEQYGRLWQVLEQKMKGTALEKSIQTLFEGHFINFIRCLDAPYSSHNNVSFYDLQLDVKGCKDVYESLKKHCSVEILDGDDKYLAGKFGLQVAEKGSRFADFPPVLQLQLNRFDFDFNDLTLVKTNDRYEFPLDLDLDSLGEDILCRSSSLDAPVRNLYTLHAVLSHNGGVLCNALSLNGGPPGGHYSVFIRFRSKDHTGDCWYHFDDKRVKEVDLHTLKGQYGGPKDTTFPTEFTDRSTASRLVYIRECDKRKVLCDVDDKEVAEHLQARVHRELNKEQEEIDVESYQYAGIKVAYEADMTSHVGKHVHFGLIDFREIKPAFKHMDTATCFGEFSLQFEEIFNIPFNIQRFWLCKRLSTEQSDQTSYRPIRPLEDQDSRLTIGRLLKLAGEVEEGAHLKLFVEVFPDTYDFRAVSSSNSVEKDLLLFLTIYNPYSRQLSYAGRCVVNAHTLPTSIEDDLQLQNLIEFSPDQSLEKYRQVDSKLGPTVKPIVKEKTFDDNGLENGDIICLQIVEPYQMPIQETIPLYFKRLADTYLVHFRRLEQPDDNVLELPLWKLSTYDQVVETLSQRLALESGSLIRLTAAYDSPFQRPKPHPIEYHGFQILHEIAYRKPLILYFETSNSLPLPKGSKTLKIVYRLRRTKRRVETLVRILQHHDTLWDVINRLKRSIALSRQEAELRVLKISKQVIFRVCRICDPDEKSETFINDRELAALVMEEITEEESNLGDQDRLLSVCHFTPLGTSERHLIQNCEEPFLLLARESDTLLDVKERVKTKLAVADEVFASWKFASISSRGSVHRYLEDGDVMAHHFPKLAAYDAWEKWLGIQHS